MDGNDLMHKAVGTVFDPLLHVILGEGMPYGKFTQFDPLEDAGGLWNPINQTGAALDFVFGTPEKWDVDGKHAARPGLFDGLF